MKRRELLCDYQTNPQIAVVCGFMCAPTDEEAHAEGRGLDLLPVRAAASTTRHGPVVPGSVNLWDEYQEWKADARRASRRSAAAG